MELLDLVDEHDNVIGITNKVESHKKRLWHRVVAVFVFDEKGELYVQRHKTGGNRYDHSIGGHVSKGESYDHAAIREAEEELGIKQPLKFLTKVDSDEGSYCHIFGLFECVADKGWKFIPNEEVEEIIPMSLIDIRKMMAVAPGKFTSGFINTMNEYCRIKKM